MSSIDALARGLTDDNRGPPARHRNHRIDGERSISDDHSIHTVSFASPRRTVLGIVDQDPQVAPSNPDPPRPLYCRAPAADGETITDVLATVDTHTEPPNASATPRSRRFVVLAIFAILAVSLGLRLYNLNFPSEYMFDEVYYAKDAKAIVDGRVGTDGKLRWAAGDSVSWPHPEMGKFAIAAGIILFGDRAIGWRLPAVLAGMVILACVYPFARRLGLSPPWAILALLLAAADPLGITQSRIATLDIFVAMWTVVCVWLALRYAQDGGRLWLALCALAGGMALATKWSGALALAAAAMIIAGTWLWRRHLEMAAWRTAVINTWDGDEWAEDAAVERLAPPAHRRPLDAVLAAIPAAAAFVLIPAAVYMLGYTQYFIAGHTLADWRELQRQMWTFGISLKATHTYASIAPSWIIDYRPVWYYFNGTTEYRAVVAIGNPFLWWLATAMMFAAPVLAVWRRNYALLAPAAIVAVLYLPWFATTRTSFLYYMTPVAPFLAVLVAVALAQILAGRDISPRLWLTLAAGAVATAVLWIPIAQLCEWLFWDLPGRVNQHLSWLATGIGIAIAFFLVGLFASRGLRHTRPYTIALLAGVTIGIAVAFIPVVLALPISPEYFGRITWFPSWI